MNTKHKVNSLKINWLKKYNTGTAKFIHSFIDGLLHKKCHMAAKG